MSGGTSEQGSGAYRRRLLVLAGLFWPPCCSTCTCRGPKPGVCHPTPGTHREFKGWIDYLADRGYSGQVYVDPKETIQRLGFYASTLLRDFTAAGVVLWNSRPFVGIAQTTRRRDPSCRDLRRPGLLVGQLPRTSAVGLLYPLLCHLCAVGRRRRHRALERHRAFPGLSIGGPESRTAGRRDS